MGDEDVGVRDVMSVAPVRVHSPARDTLVASIHAQDSDLAPIWRVADRGSLFACVARDAYRVAAVERTERPHSPAWFTDPTPHAAPGPRVEFARARTTVVSSGRWCGPAFSTGSRLPSSN